MNASVPTPSQRSRNRLRGTRFFERRRAISTVSFATHDRRPSQGDVRHPKLSSSLEVALRPLPEDPDHVIERQSALGVSPSLISLFRHDVADDVVELVHLSVGEHVTLRDLLTTLLRCGARLSTTSFTRWIRSFVTRCVRDEESLRGSLRPEPGFARREAKTMLDKATC